MTFDFMAESVQPSPFFAGLCSVNLFALPCLFTHHYCQHPPPAMDRSSEGSKEKNGDGQTSPMPISWAACDESSAGVDTGLDRPPSCCSSRSPVSYDEHSLRCGDQCTLW
jgi:hypothetical protein